MHQPLGWGLQIIFQFGIIMNDCTDTVAVRKYDVLYNNDPRGRYAAVAEPPGYGQAAATGLTKGEPKKWPGIH